MSNLSHPGSKRHLFVVTTLVLMLVMVTAVYAITITIDGTRESAWDSGDSESDPNEGSITNDGVDLATVEWTNDTTNFYLLAETHAATTWDLPGFTDAEMIFCINNDNNTGTGSSLPSQCLESGYDRYIQIVGPTPTISVFDGSFSPIAATTDIAVSGSITEISVDLASLGLNSSNCGTIPVGTYFDGQTQDPDDNVTDTGDITMNCGSPTAVSLQSITATSNNPLQVAALIGGLLLAVLGAGAILYRRQKV